VTSRLKTAEVSVLPLAIGVAGGVWLILLSGLEMPFVALQRL
jgi:hypothetical protein